MPTLHIHADESGDLRFDAHGSRYFTFAAAWTFDPSSLADSLTRLRYSILREGRDLERFHATNDHEHVRQRVIETMLADDRWSYVAFVVDKSKHFEQLRDSLRFYPRFLPMVLGFVRKGQSRPGTDRVLIYTDRIPINRTKRRHTTTCSESAWPLTK